MTSSVEVPAVSARVGSGSSRRRPPAAGARRLAAVLAGASLGGGTYLALEGGDASLPWTVCLCAALVCLVPSDRRLSRRVAINGVAALGLVPVLWTTDALASANHGALVVAVVAGLLLAVVVAAPDPVGAARSLVPEVVPADLLLLPSAAAASAWGWRLLTVRTPARALEVLLPGYDHAAHFDIFQMLWRHGGPIAAVGPSPDGTPFEYAGYPSGFHAVAASVAQLGDGVRPPTPDLALVTYAHVDALVVVAGTVVATACLISVLPRPRVLPLLAPLTLVLTALLWLPGGQVLWHGFENFWLAAVLCGCALLLAARAVLRGRIGLGELVAVQAAATGVALNWLPLLSVCWVGPAVAGVLWWRSRHEGWRRAAGLLAGATTVAVVLATALDLFRTTTVSTLVDASGGIEASPLGPVVVMLLLLAGLTVVLGDGTGRLRGVELRRLRWIGLGVLCGVGLAALFAVAQRSSTGRVDYYAIKLSLGVLLIATCWVAGMLALALDRVLPAAAPHRRGGWVRLGAVALGCVVCTQLLGQMSLAEAEEAARLSVPRDLSGRPLDYGAMAAGVLAAASSTGREEALRAEYVALGSAHCYVASLPDSWFHALTESLTERTSTRSAGLDLEVYTPTDASVPVGTELGRDASLRVLVGAEHAAELGRLLGPELGQRVHATALSGDTR